QRLDLCQLHTWPATSYPRSSKGHNATAGNQKRLHPSPFLLHQIGGTVRPLSALPCRPQLLSKEHAQPLTSHTQKAADSQIACISRALPNLACKLNSKRTGLLKSEKSQDGPCNNISICQNTCSKTAPQNPTAPE